MRAGDPGVAAWAVTALYLLAAWRCWRVQQPGGARLFWRLAALLLLLLGINKQLDLQTQLIAAMRGVAQAGGWYPYRREVQMLSLAAGLALQAAAVAVMALAIVRGRIALGTGGWTAAAGLAMVVVGVSARAALILHVDALAAPANLVHFGLEPVGLMVVLAGTLLAARQPIRR